MTDYREPRTTEQAVILLEQFSALSAEVAGVEANRNAAIAATNAVADTLAAPMLGELDQLRAKLASWWGKKGAELTQGKRKSIVLGGCELGSRMPRATLRIAGDEDAVVQALSAVRWGKPFLRTKVSIDRVATLKGLDGAQAPRLVELGFSRETGAPEFFVKAVEQGGTLPVA